MKDKAKILVVDDEIAVGAMMAFLLTRGGCKVETVTNAEQALRLARMDGFDLITLDVELPGSNGFEIYQRLREFPHLKNTPICFVSGRPTVENIQRAEELGAADFIEKPFGASDFVARILSCVKEGTPA